METARLKNEQTKSEPVSDRSKRTSALATVNSHRPLTLDHANSTTLRLGHAFGPSVTSLRPLQAKLTVNEPGDQYEQEADRVAERVMRMPDPTLRLQRKCGCGGSTASAEPCAECASHAGQIQRAALPESSPAETAPSIVHDVLRLPGQPLDQSTRAFFESRMGHDFGSVRVHTDGEAARSARSVNALAYTVGRDVVFGEGQFAPGTGTGRQLIAHELSHVVQQGQQNQLDSKSLRIGPANDSFERQAEQHATSSDTDHAGASLSAQGPPAGTLQRVHPAVVAAGGAAAFLAGFGIAYGIDYAAMTRARALRYGQDLDTTYPGWLSALPNCPCTLPCEVNTPLWERDLGNLPRYHPGASFSCRSTAAATGGSRHGQQCTYDAARGLITSGAGAGTPDVYSPSSSWGVVNLPYHHVYDVKTWQELGWQTYTQYWRPNNGLGCPANERSSLT